MGNSESSDDERKAGSSSASLQVDGGCRPRARSLEPAADRDAPDLRLSATQVRHIRRFWRQQAKGRAAGHSGDVIFAKLLAKSPDIRAVFEQRADFSGFQHHYEVFSTALERIVELLDQPTELDAYLTALGRRHASLRADGFNPKMWQAFGEAMILCALDWGKRNEDVQQAWSDIVLFTIDRMRDGYSKEMRQMRGGSARAGNRAQFLGAERPFEGVRRASFR